RSRREPPPVPRDDRRGLSCVQVDLPATPETAGREPGRTLGNPREVEGLLHALVILAGARHDRRDRLATLVHANLGRVLRLLNGLRVLRCHVRTLSSWS